MTSNLPQFDSTLYSFISQINYVLGASSMVVGYTQEGVLHASTYFHSDLVETILYLNGLWYYKLSDTDYSIAGTLFEAVNLLFSNDEATSPSF